MNDNFKCIYKILKTLEKAMDYPEFDTSQIDYHSLEVSKERWSRYIEMMSDTEYIKGVKINRYINGETDVDISDIRITLKGLEYLSENSIMQRLYKSAMGVKNIMDWHQPPLNKAVFLFSKTVKIIE